MRKKAVFFDIDGTLFDFRTGIPPSTREAIRQLKKNGHAAFLCTGRTRACIYYKELLELPFDGIVAACGAYVSMGDAVLLNQELSREKLAVLLRLCRQYQMYPMLEGSEFLYYDREMLVEKYKDAYLTAVEKDVPDRVRPIPDDLSEIHANKYCLLLEDPQSAEEALDILKDDFTVMHITERLREVVPLRYSKATGIELVCRYMGLEPSDTFAFGDSVNDIEMLRAAGCGIAMGNASEIAKQSADYVTAGILEHGIALGLKKFGLI